MRRNHRPGRGLSSFVLTAIVAMTAATTLAAPLITPIGRLPGDSSVATAAAQQDNTNIARGGNQFLVVWVDNRTSYSGLWTRTEYNSEQTGNDIYAARLDAAGNRIDATPIVIDQTYGYQRAAQVAWNGQNWLVAYRRQELNATYYDEFIRAPCASRRKVSC